MIRKAQNSVQIVTTEEGIMRKLNALRTVLKKAHDKGVSIQVKAPVTDKNKEIVESSIVSSSSSLSFLR